MAPCAKGKGRGPDPLRFDMKNTARKHAQTRRNNLPLVVLCPCRLASPKPPIPNCDVKLPEQQS